MVRDTGEPGRTRVVLFIVTSFWAFGELTIATEFAQRLAGTGFRPLFLIPPSHRRLIADSGLDYQVLIPGAGNINRIQLRDIAHVHRPALVVLADFLNFDFCQRHYGLLREDLQLFDCPVGTFDDFTWGRPGSWLDTYGFKAKYEEDISLDGLSFRLRPCPLNNPLQSHDEPGVYAYPLLNEAPGWLERERVRFRAEVRTELGVPDGRPLVLLTSATWQQMHAAYPRVKAFVGASIAMTEHLIRALLAEAYVVCVGPPTVFVAGEPDGFRNLGQLEPVRFRRLVAGVDLHISNNIVSVSLHRLALAGIPSVVLHSSLSKADSTLSWAGSQGQLSGFAARVIERVEYLYPFRMFPVGWYHFLHSLLAGNSFTDVVSSAEVFQEERALETILALLRGPERRAQVEAARQSYLAALASLPTVETILRELVPGPHQ